jgi:undecaprenyl phosphate-alpha-L-ara4FN deformylase
VTTLPAPAPAAIGLKIDVDTHDGMRDGVPRLLDALGRRGVRATFFLVLGPDRMGRALLQLRHPRFLRKMLATNAPSLYGWRTTLSGTVLPARGVATAFPDLVRRMAAAGHEAAVHAWDHRAWQDELDTFSDRRIRQHLDRACTAFRALTGHDPVGIGAPAWTTSPRSLAIQDGFPFRYASDLRGGVPCRLRTPLGEHRLPQLPGTGLCIEELLGLGVRSDAALAAGVLRTGLTGVTPVLTLHAEVEGGPYLGALERLFDRLAARGLLGRLRPCAEIAAGLGALPVRNWCRRRLAGRAFPVSTAR